MKQLLNEKEINLRLDKLAAFIEEDCERLGGGITFICVLNGGFMFFSDLVKRIKYPIKIDFIQCKSYDGKTQKELKITKDIDIDIDSHTVFIIDDILDSGNTMNHLFKHFESKGAKNIFTVTSVYKENVDFPNNYFIYKQPDNVNPWYVGYGMDDKGYNRNLNSINAV